MSSPPLSLKQPLQSLRLLLTHPAYFWLLSSLVILGDALLTQLIIRFVAYTEIDWVTYMHQVSLYDKGERDYSRIEGPTGPLVYPAGHVYLHQILYHVTRAGIDSALAQQIYAVLYLASQALTCAIYGRAGGVPNWVVLLLPLSKRLHSIYVLRLFNDCWAVVTVLAAILAYENRRDDVGTVLFSAALSVKMSILLYLPGLLVILFTRHGLLGTFRHMVTVLVLQTLLAWPFLQQHPWPYLRNAFDLSRAFLYKWTVNWRFVDEQTFLSAPWTNGLLVGHVGVLLAFGLWRWCRSEGGVWTLLVKGLRRPTVPAGLSTLPADYVATVLFTSNLIGILFARSLHYQFYSWYAQQLPFLTWRTKYPVVLKIALLASIEYSWNVYPSTPLSSGLLCASHVTLLGGIWFGWAEGIA